MLRFWSLIVASTSVVRAEDQLTASIAISLRLLTALGPRIGRYF